jgi:hypothetical protein
MRTEELVRLLAAGEIRTNRDRVGLAITGALVMAFVASFALMSTTMGIRDTLVRDFPDPHFWLKEIVCATLAIYGIWGSLRLAVPGRRLGSLALGVGVPLMLIEVVAAVTLVAAGRTERESLVLGQTWQSCPWAIDVIALPILLVMLWSVRQLAPTRLRMAGAAVGFAAGAAGATIYSLHCPELAPPFVGTWYVLGMLLMAALGASIGPRILRW